MSPNVRTSADPCVAARHVGGRRARIDASHMTPVRAPPAQNFDLLTKMEAGESAALIFTKVDRASRCTEDFARLIRLFDEQGWRLIVTEMGIDTRTPMDKPDRQREPACCLAKQPDVPQSAKKHSASAEPTEDPLLMAPAGLRAHSQPASRPLAGAPRCPEFSSATPIRMRRARAQAHAASGPGPS